MGQAFIIVNLDRREILNPGEFNHGYKFLEFTSAGNGIMQALALLTSVGNGAGRGDLCRDVYEGDPDFEPASGERIHSEIQSDRDRHRCRLPEGQSTRVRTIVPAMTGRWAGERIVTAGECMPPCLHMTKVEQLKACNDSVGDMLRGRSAQATGEIVVYSPNLYDLARFYTDISHNLREQIAPYIQQDPHYIMERLAERLLSTRLLAEFEYRKRMGRGKAAKWKWDLSWMEYELIDSFLLRWDDPLMFKAAKKWLRGQILQPWQKYLIAGYKRLDARPADSICNIALSMKNSAELQAGNKPREFREYTPILPSASYLKAGLAIEQQQTEGEAPTLMTKDARTTILAEQMGVVTRQRVIDLNH